MTDNTVSIEDFLELYDAAHAVIDKIKMHVDHAEYEGGMNAVEYFRDTASQLRWKYADKVPEPERTKSPKMGTGNARQGR